MQACVNGTITFLGNCSESSVLPGQLYYAGTESSVRASSSWPLLMYCHSRLVEDFILCLPSGLCMEPRAF